MPGPPQPLAFVEPRQGCPRVASERQLTTGVAGPAGLPSAARRRHQDDMIAG